MNIKYKELTIRTATDNDSITLLNWWNDGKVMAHAGFPNGLNETVESINKVLLQNRERFFELCIIEFNDTPIGEVNYRKVEDDCVEIGIKICDFAYQNKGYGKLILSMIIEILFNDLEFKKIILDTNLNNLPAQKLYHSIGFKELRINKDAWKNQLGELQSSIDYELYRDDFVSFL
jgi:RimJ/RimL family protein N-acetyltransferase